MQALRTLGMAVGTLLLFAAVAPVQAGCTPQPAPLTLTDKDDGKSVALVVGQSILIRLTSNPTTGYQWQVHGSPTPLSLVKSEYVSEGKNMPGAGGTQVIELTAKSTGEVTLTLGYRRPWENDLPAKTFTAKITVK